MFFKALCLMLVFALIGATFVTADEPAAARPGVSRLTTEELARWIDERFAAAWVDAKIESPAVIDDATFFEAHVSRSDRFDSQRVAGSRFSGIHRRASPGHVGRSSAQ